MRVGGYKLAHGTSLGSIRFSVPKISFSLEVTGGKNLFKRATVQFPKDSCNFSRFSQILGGNKHSLFPILLISVNPSNFYDYQLSINGKQNLSHFISVVLV